MGEGAHKATQLGNVTAGTGVQGCALGLSPPSPPSRPWESRGQIERHQAPKLRTQGPPPPTLGLPFRVKFLVMSDRGPVAATDWSSDTRLQQGMGQRSSSHTRAIPSRGLGVGQPVGQSRLYRYAVGRQPSPNLVWVVDLEAVPGPPSQVRSYLFPPCTACPACLWGPLMPLSRGTPGYPRAPERRHSGHHCRPVSAADGPPHGPPWPAHLHLVSGLGPWEG